MPISKSDQVYKLIKSLNKAEKRNFKLFVNRLNSNKDGKFLQLFEYLDKIVEYEDALIKKKFPTLKTGDISNLKRHLYDQILKSLRLIHIKRDVDLQIREQMDYAKILYGKGLYLQSLKLLDRVKVIAKNSEQEIIYLEITEFQKLIESRHITRSRKIENKVEDLILGSAVTRQVVARTSRLSNLSLKIQGLYIKLGFVKNNMEKFLVNEYFTSNFPTTFPSKMGFYEEVLLNQSSVWYNYMLMQFEKSLMHSKMWVQVFHRSEVMKQKDPDLYIRGLHYVLTNCFYLKEKESFKEYLDIYKKYLQIAEADFNINTQILNFNYYHNALINQCLIEKDYKSGLKLVPTINLNIKSYKLKLDSHRVLMFYYKIAWMYIACGQYEQAIDYLKKIIDNKKDHLRNDLIAYAKLLQLLCHYKLQNYTLITNLSPMVKRHFEVSGQMNSCIQSILLFLNKHPNEFDKHSAIDKVYQKIIASESHPYEKRCFIYFNFRHWIEGLRETKTMNELTI